MAPPPFLRILGRPALFDGYGAPIRLKSQKHLALLAYLNLEGRGQPVRRECLADLLWPGADLKDGRHSLVVALSDLRARLDREGLPADQATVRLTVELATDLQRLERGEVLATDLEPALELDAFLEELEIPDAPAFGHWRDERRARYWPLIEGALVRQMDHCRRTGDSGGILELADRTLRHNPLSEPAVRARMEARAFAGDRIGALRTFEQWRQALYTDLKAEPSERMERFARRLRRGTREGGGDGTRPRVPAEQWRDRSFIGRAQEYRTLYEAWERTAGGQPTHAFVLGESGIGKSTLLQRLLTAVSLDGAVTSRVQCYELERDIPYAGLGALVRGLLERPEARGTSPQSLADLAQAVPAVRDQFPSLPDALQLHGESFRIRVTDAMESLLRSIAEETPVFLVVDDVHLMDDASASVVHLLTRRFEGERVMVAVAARPTTANESPNFAKLRESHRRLGFVSVEVPPLAEDEARAMLDGLLAGAPEPGRAVREAMLRAAGGYPMALDLFASEWNATGEDSLALAVPAMREELGQRRPPEDAYRMALHRICDGLDGPTRLALQLASVLGARLNDLGMYQVIGQGLGSTGPAMETLQALRLLRETEDRLEFVNELIRDHVYVSTPAPIRTRLHAEVTARLLDEESRGGHAPGLEIAWHLIRAGRRDEATPYLLRGARESMREGAPYEAERGLTTALDRLKEPEKSEALLLIGEALQEQGRMQESVGFLNRVSALAAEDVVVRRDVLHLHAVFATSDRCQDPDREIANQLLAKARTCKSLSTKLRAIWVAGSRPREGLEPQDVQKVLDELASIDSTRLSLEDLGEYALGKAFCEYSIGDIQGCLTTISRIIPQLEQAGINNSVYRMLRLGLAVAQSTSGDYLSAKDVTERTFRIAQKAGDERRAMIAAGNAALYCSRTGDTTAQLAWALEALQRGSHPGDTLVKIRCLHYRADALARLGREEEATINISSALELSRSAASPWVIQMSFLMAADLYLFMGRADRAESMARSALMAGQWELLADSPAGRFARWVARLAVSGTVELGYAHNQLSALRAREQKLDRLDQAELANAIVWLETKLKGTRTGGIELEEMWNRLAELPTAITNDLKRMGMVWN